MNQKARRKKVSSRHCRRTLEKVLEEGGVRRGFWMAGVPTSREEWWGSVAEKKATEAFSRLKQKKVEFPEVGVIKCVIPTQHLSPEDKQAIDIKTQFISGTIVFCEVKSRRWTSAKATEFLKQNRCFIGIPWNVSNEEAEEMVHYALTWFLDNRTKKAEANLSERAIRRASFSLYGLTSFFRSFNIKK